MSDQKLTLSELAQIVGASVDGDGTFPVAAIAPLDQAGPTDLTFADARRASDLAASKAGAAIVEGDGEVDFAGRPVIRVANVQLAVYQALCHLAGPEQRPAPGIAETATVAPSAKLGQDVHVGPGAVVGEGATIGDRTVLLAHAVVAAGCSVGDDCTLAEGCVVRGGSVIGSRVRVGPNSVIGYDGFGFQTIDGVHKRVPHLGNVVIEDDVEIDACTCVDRGKFGATRIERGAKIDNHVQIGHNCRIGPGSFVVGMVGIAGSVNIGKYCVIAGHVGIADNLSVGDGSMIGAYSGVIKSVPPGGRVVGHPAIPVRNMMKVWSSWPKLPELVRQVHKLQARLEAVESGKTENH